MKVVLYVCACGNAITLNSLMAFHRADLPGNVQLQFREVRCAALHHAMDKPEMRRVEVDV
jgi:hypothetical protein